MKNLIKTKLRESLNEFSNGVYDNGESPIERLRTDLNYILGAIEMFQDDESEIDDLVDAVGGFNISDTTHHIKQLGNHYNKSLFEMINMISRIKKREISIKSLKNIDINSIHQYIQDIQPLHGDSSYKELKRAV
jgi:hypothetical protein